MKIGKLDVYKGFLVTVYSNESVDYQLECRPKGQEKGVLLSLIYTARTFKLGLFSREIIIVLISLL